ncbi:MAG: head-tail connector protein [Limimaricola soesokkakensis]|uniref:head-tail connector protein n=1 Tax=Limimaricola soesokkakensis TaxID=1343159 RepID=UPI004059F107
MWRGVTVKTPPAVPVLAAADLAARLRIEDPAEHDLLAGFLAEATAEIDGPQGIGVAMVEQTWTLTLDRFFPLIDLPGWPVTAVSAIRYLDADDAEQVLDPATYRLVTARDPALVLPVRGAAWPAIPCQPGAVSIDYTVGQADPAQVHPSLVNAAAMIAGHYYENREATTAGPEIREVPMGPRRILDRFRRGTVGG